MFGEGGGVVRIALGIILVLVGVAGLGLGGVSYWWCFLAADDDLPDARELQRQAAEEVQRRAGQRRGALGELVTKPSREQIAADPEKAERAVREADEFLKEWDDTRQRTDQTIRDKSTTWRAWHFVRGTAVLLFSLGVLVAGIERFKRPGRVRAEPVAAPDAGRE
jgi:hypothetical protein